jgi:hypothetical protein
MYIDYAPPILYIRSPVMKASITLDQSCPTERCILLRSRRSLALYSKSSKSDVRRLAMSDGLKVVLGALGGALLVLLLIGGFSGSGMGYGMMGGMGQMMGGSMMGGGIFGMLFAGLFWVLLLALLVAVVVWIFNQAQRR